ncbi:prostaglandin E synthase 2 [Thrips palmi]|uniref:Prostaglandin E synthase 2 n=1 Tax=Thrips palmi TaxID=161013 RepID=A0A6P9AH81_THRPL|nr:prostaglandin E synthase 2 [Thrips palmi]
MAAFSRSVCTRHFRTVFTFCKNEQPNSLIRSLNWGPRRQFSGNGTSRRPAVAQANVLYFALGGMAAGVAYTFWDYSRKSIDYSAVVNDTEFKPTILTALPPHTPSRQISFPSDNSGLKLVLYQYPTCPFCCKVRAFLDYYGLSYDVVEVDPVLRTEMKWSEYKKVPILLAGVGDGKYLQLNDSTLIISVLKSFLADPKKDLLSLMSSYPPMSYRDEDGSIKTEIQNRYYLMTGEDVQKDKKEKIMEEVKWREWADKKLVHVLSPNVYRTVDESLQSFEWFSEVGEWDRLFPSWERNLIVYAGAYAMWLIGKRLKKRHLLKDDVRISLYDELNFWLRNLKKKGTSFNGGKKPDLADLAVYGVLSSIEGCQAFKDAVENTKIEGWYMAMKEFASTQAGSRL